MSNRRTQSTPRRGPPKTPEDASGVGRCPCGRQPSVAYSGRPHSHEVFRRAVDIDDFDLPMAVGGEPGPLKCMRRDRDRGAPCVGHLSEELLDRRQCSAVAQLPRGNDRRDPSGETRSRSPGRHQRGCSGRVKSFCNALLRSTAPLGSSTVLRCGQGDVVSAAAKTCNSRLGGRDTPGWKAADRTLASIRATRVACGPGIKFPVRRRRGWEPVLYTVQGRQAGDLPQKCGSALIRRVKPPARSGGRSSLLAGMADKAH
jgi:hypothetical protein